MTRRVLLGTGAVVAAGAALVVGAELTGRLDDVAGAVGLDPKPLPDPADTALVRAAARDMAALVALVEATAARHADLALAPFEQTGREQLEALGGSTAATDVAPPSDDAATAVGTLVTTYRDASIARAVQAGRAFSPDLARLLASMSAGLAQGERALEGLR